MNGLKGIHHVTAITSSAEKNYEFFTYILGMRLVKKTVNQDDIQTYHLFFADDVGGPGTDMTFFDFPGIPKGVHGTNEISKTSFRVPNDAALEYWVKRFDRLEVRNTGIQEQFGKKIISFVDFDDQQYQLISDENNEGVAAGIPWQKGPIPLEYAITGLGPIFIRIANFDYFKEMMEKVLLFKEIDKEGSFHLFEVGEGGNGAQVIVEHNSTLPQARQGFGTVHHTAFRVEDRSVLEEWIKRMESFQFHTSGYVDRHFFESLYVRVAPQILFEFATDGPGFMGDEPYETLGEKLSLPPFLEPKRDQIEKLVRPIDTERSTKEIIKE
ncbi:ring-cleaving dioxygenase [Peribacillus simplex]|uniref:Ring-cleaving dioxygenase n=1 Tax=Peribacillus simplex NBRC 15720 = DSM 1321 TaxID=1349754 RepID=A0A223EBV9_9BACI|nr:ring-cleaving dioxygenase [Peribacillus simplex]ASS92728.1 ring-cleaving dioxygenase [Peribacillus simplex NBRC 15720 = DSM 1321]MEC1398253.1 ring-cleaving dioxygenase [Peribacillus simplex]MED3986747.1 ring-cleaving dioxygenase [Peribacillus simplex]MED4094861.1 ring-cleaving dioxygenase [Peribacillus simplex]CAH0292691.1 Putative ring-cleaving dioxygenase MhqA [Peribacillus simplex]